jgi:hypothetical protein
LALGITIIRIYLQQSALQENMMVSQRFVGIGQSLLGNLKVNIKNVEKLNHTFWQRAKSCSPSHKTSGSTIGTNPFCWQIEA